MADVKREFGVIGLGRMGGGLALQARDGAKNLAREMRHGFGGHPYGQDGPTFHED